MSSVHSFHFGSQALKLLVLAILLAGAVSQAKFFEFNYTTFEKDNRTDFNFTENADISSHAIEVTKDISGGSIANMSGRVWYHRKFMLWDKKKNTIASFNTTFKFNIKNRTTVGGEGLALIFTKDIGSLPENSQGQWLGIVNASTNGSDLAQTVAIEFDTKKSYLEDIDNNHVGVDLNSIYSIKQVSLGGLGIDLSAGEDITAKVEYDGTNKSLKVFVFLTANDTGGNTKDPVISMADLDLSEYLPEYIWVGFSASTGINSTQLNCVKSWHFIGIVIDQDSTHWLLVMILIPLLVIIFLCGFSYYKCRKSGDKKLQGQEQEKYPGIEQELQISTTVPQKYQLKEILFATNNFNPKNKLGEGGFGTVYKGLLTNKEVAVKRISKDSRQGKQEFLAEVKTISGLHHKNLVKLVGWCYENNELLLVYEFMPNGSLDKLIFSNERASTEISTTLSWERRHGIIFGVGQALDYLHSGCEQRVLHRDIKASNIMLDSEFNARLGDFGLARTIRLSERTHHSTKEIAGTPGYIAPEFFLNGRAGAEIDVYAFGILLLEVACGKRPRHQNEQNHYTNGIVEWVWELYKRNRIIDAMDVRLNGAYENDQAERVLLLGLACCHPNPYERPPMRTVLQVLTGEADPPDVPIEKPAFIWPAMPLSFGSSLGLSLSGGHLSPSPDFSGR